MKPLQILNAIGILSLFFYSAQAGSEETVKTIEQAINESINANPDVIASWHQLNAALEEKRQAQGQYFPQVELNAQAAHTDSSNPQFRDETYRSNLSRLTVTQNLFNGGATHYQVKKLDRLSLARYYELKNAAESLALQSIQAYLDVLRYQELVHLAKEGYIEHKLLHQDIQKRSKAGISRAVDFEQAEARLALAESNLLTESANLHDVTVRFIRLLGKPPAKQLHKPRIPNQLLPTDLVAALSEAYKYSPIILAATYNYRSAEAEVREKKSAYYPTLDLRARKELYDDDAISTPANFDETAVELVFTYKLYAGGANAAATRKYQELELADWQLREKACRDVTQTVSVAMNNVSNSRKQVALLKKNQISIDRVRTAYRNQFSIGQRTLLDLLDTENEYFDVQRSLVNATYDAMIAEVTTLAGIGKLTEAFKAKGLIDVAQEQTDLDLTATTIAACQVPTDTLATIQKQDILAEVLADERLRPVNQTVRKVIVVAPKASAKDRLSFRLNVQYQNGSAALLASYSKDIEVAAKYLTDNPKVKGIIEGHSDSVGSADYNLKLSQARAETLKSLLVRDYHIAAERLSAVGYGEQVPIATNATEEGRRENRRVLLVIVDE